MILIDSALIPAHSYYQLEDASGNHVNKFLTNTVDHALQELNESYCINLEEVSYSS